MKKFLTVALLALTIGVSACWFTAVDWQVVYFTRVNDTDITPTFGTFPTVSAPEAGTQNVPCTILIKAVPSVTNGTPIQQALLQWKYASGTTWKTVNNLENFTWVLDFSKPIPLFGRYNFNPAGVATGDVLLVRLQVTDATTVNAQIDVDTTAEGTNGWQDSWVFSMTVGSVRR